MRKSWKTAHRALGKGEAESSILSRSTRLIREHPRFQRTGIIFVSAVSTSHLDQLRGYDLGAFDYIPLPVAPTVPRQVRVFVDLYRKNRELERCNAELEQRVIERTTTLRRLNEELEARIEDRTREREKALAQLFAARRFIPSEN